MITPIGEVTLGASLPAVSAAYATALANIQEEIAALAAFQVTITTPGLDLAVNAQVAAGLLLSISLGVLPPSIEAQVSIVLDMLLKLQLELQVLFALDNLLRERAFLYTYAGTTSSFGTELQAEIGSGFPGGVGSDVAFAVVLGATTAAGKAALQSLFKVTP